MSTFPVTTRSRTLLFISYRDSAARPRPARRRRHPSADNIVFDADTDADEHEHLISHVALDVDLPPKWVDVSDQVHDLLAAATTKIATVDKLHAKHVLPGFSDRSAEERDIELLTTDITRHFRRCHALIQSIQPADPSPAHAFPPAPPSSHERRAAENVQRALAAKVQELSAAFRKKQRVYMDTLQGHASRNKDLLVASGAISLKGAEGISELEDDVQVAARGQTQATHAVQAQEELPDVDLAQRDREITEIARSIGQLAELFRDLGSLVIDQGSLLDSVEYNVEQTAVHIEDAATQLNIAETYQKNTGRRACIFLLLLIIFGLVLVLIFKPRRHGNLPNTNASLEDGTTTRVIASAPEATITTTTAHMNDKDESNFNTVGLETDKEGDGDGDGDTDLGLLPPLPMVTPDLSGFGLGNRIRIHNRNVKREEGAGGSGPERERGGRLRSLPLIKRAERRPLPSVRLAPLEH